jgi:calcium-dependent protein kinase
LNHPWFKKFNDIDAQTSEQTLNSLTNLKTFNASNKLQQAVASLIST